MNVVTDTYTTITTTIVSVVSTYVPKLVAGLLILVIGLIIASLVRDLIRLFFKYVKIEKWLEAAGVAKEKEIAIWPNLLAELVRWTTIFIFLMSAVEVWGVPKVADVLNELLLFLPNVFVAVVIGWIGLVAAKFSFNIVRHSVQGLGDREALILGSIARYAIVFFTILIILTQLGVAADLVRILFTGIVGMLALAGGLAFGLGGKDEAAKLLKQLLKRLEK